ncbi:extracellular matrix regulator RemB [Caldisalinibacter kiritimatiensis]|uniref:OrfX n=1 Tax=Caldisalinibacter kiritimatiensis TaxID=1304284 RepID=R1AQN7_9FIRM|nr:extracellular matrix/biofilm biosynthesis regulator RemA family protein [Caldisalinibacter kiritimatiensis]EOC99437.1 OrfX [Caldisalinibacter kiritimatiensis]
MFLHLGKDLVIPLKDIIAIVDADSLGSQDTRDFFKIAEEEGFIYNIVNDNIKSYIITERIEKDKNTGEKIRKSIIYCSNISSTTLYKRANFMKKI